MKQFDRALNAGCMINGYMPVTFVELIKNNEIFKAFTEETLILQPD